MALNPILADFDGMARSKTIGNTRLLFDITQLDVINNGDVYAKFLKMARIFVTTAALGFLYSVASGGNAA
ncbi:hypothetical protein HSBAA_PA_0990 (plasmid) [Vreelandella sulfidaeris]|uniref:Uncharacterized protein n=1 Tax=Vreelandella sulfidaeris TaxID=115553 RepID=A0A455UGV2_9GAMM|nr:hypothetical protein HSBAA_PA_0990 [Halomonas sulfidaeris]